MHQENCCDNTPSCDEEVPECTSPVHIHGNMHGHHGRGHHGHHGHGHGRHRHGHHGHRGRGHHSRGHMVDDCSREEFDCGKDEKVIRHQHVVRHQYDIINDYDVVHEHDYNYYDVVNHRDVVRHNDFTNHQPNYCDDTPDCGPAICRPVCSPNCGSYRRGRYRRRFW